MVLALVAASLCATTGCGGSEEGGSTPKPTSVSVSDLDKDGDYWVTLTPDLKDELVEMGKKRLGEERPDGATGIQAAPTDELVAEIEKEYSNASKRTGSIFSTYTGANDKLAKSTFDDAIDQMDQLCSTEPRPPQCDTP